MDIEMKDGSFLEVLKNRNFIFLWLAQTFAQFADRIFLFFMVVLVTKDQFSNSAVGMLTLIHTMPAIIFGSIAGVFVDRLQKKNIMAICNIFRAISVFMLPFSEKFAYLYLITFIVSSFTQFFAPAEAAMIPILIDKKNLLPANSLFMGTMFSSVVFGFALGAPIISSFSEATNIMAIGSMYFLSAFFIFMVGIKEKVSHNHKESSFIKEYKDGYLYVIGHKTILFCVIRQIIVFSAFAALSVLVIGFVNDVLYLNTSYFGYLLAIAGAGMGIGSLFSGKFGNRIGKDRIIFIGFIVSSIALVILSLTNYIAWGFGMERVTQQKELFQALNILSNNNKNISLIQDLGA
ncbi:MAG: MFS transporter, partial [Candidatus Sericytochromatia bacterium]